MTTVTLLLDILKRSWVKKLHDVLLCISELVKLIVVDEVHCILKWGPSFRPIYSDLASLRALFSCAKVMAMTASVTQKGREEIAQLLKLRDYWKVIASCDRNNIFRSACKRPSSTGDNNTAKESHTLFLSALWRIVSRWCDVSKDGCVYNYERCGFAFDYFHQKVTLVNSSTQLQMISMYHASCTDDASL